MMKTKKLKSENYLGRKINYQQLPSSKGGSYVYGYYIRKNHKKSSFHGKTKSLVSNFLKKEIKKYR